MLSRSTPSSSSILITAAFIIGGPPVPPYDTAGWTLAYQMGVEAVAVKAPFQATLRLLADAPRVATADPVDREG